MQNVVILYWLKHYHLLKAGDSVLELGSQQINNDIIANLKSLDGLAELFSVEPFAKAFDWKTVDPEYLQSGMAHLPENAPLARHLYEHLGLKYDSVDIDDNPRSLRLDLNYDFAPKERRGRYALVTNLGTTEHATNQLNAFKIIHDFTAPNGIMVHSLPFQGFETHGLVNYTMKFFWLLVRSNMYHVIDADIAAWKKTPIPNSIVDFVKGNSRIFSNKEHVEKLELQDTGLTIVLQKRHEMEFVPPLDVPSGVQTSDPVLRKRYWTVLEPESQRVRVLKTKDFFKKVFDFLKSPLRPFRR